MDPSELLAQIRDHAVEAQQGRDVRRNERELRWKFEQLDDWLCKGGFLPVQWRMPPTRS